MSGFKELKVWQIGMELVVQVYRATADFPKHEVYGLASQMRRCAVSIPSNIAEGASRNSDKEFMQFLYIANGSLSELDTQLIISHKLGYIAEISNFDDALKQLRAMINGLINSLRHKIETEKKK